jgi:hypothetical protein
MRDRDQKNDTLPGPGRGPKEKLYRDRKKFTGTTTGTGTNA